MPAPKGTNSKGTILRPNKAVMKAVMRWAESVVKNFNLGLIK